MRTLTLVALAAFVLTAPPLTSGTAALGSRIAPALAVQSAPTDRLPSATYPQWTGYQTVWGGNNPGNGGGFQDISNQDKARIDLHGMVTVATPISWTNSDVALVNDSYRTRWVRGYSKPQAPQFGGLPSPNLMAVGPDETLHALWIQQYDMIDGYGTATAGQQVVYRSQRKGIWSAPKTITPLQAWVSFDNPQMQVDSKNVAHIILHVSEANPNPNGSVHANGWYLAYTSSVGGYHMLKGTESIPFAWNGGGGTSGPPGAVWSYFRLLNDDTCSITWAAWYPNGTTGNLPSGVLYYRGPLGQDVTSATLYTATFPGSLTVAWGTDRAVGDLTGNDHVFYQFNGSGPMIHLVNNAQVESFTIPAGVEFGNCLGFDSRGQLHVVGNNWHWIKRTDGTWVYGPSAVPSGYAGTLTFGRNDEMFVVRDGCVTRTMSHTLGVRDPAAHAPVLPGGSVDLVSGNFHYQLPLFSTKGVGPCQSMTLYYNSLDNRAGYISPGWRLNYEMYITHMQVPYQQADRLSLTLPDGRNVIFTGDPVFNYIPLPEYGFSGFIQILGTDRLDSQYRLTVPNGTMYLFDKNGKLISIIDPSGNELDLIYDSDGYLTQVVDMLGNGGSGRTSTIEYMSAPDSNYPKRISKIKDPNGAEYQFQYDGWNLKLVGFVGGNPVPAYAFVTTSSEYQNNRYKQLLERMVVVMTPNGGAWSLEYLPDGRVSKATDPDGKKIQINYDETVPPDQPRHTLVTDRRGFVTEYTLDAMRSLALTIKDPGFSTDPQHPISAVQRTFDADGQLLSVQDRYGKLTTYIYTTDNFNSSWCKGLVGTVKRPSASGAGQDTVSTTTYSSQGFLMPVVVQSVTTYATPTGGGSPSARQTTFTYTPAVQDRPSTITYPTLTRPDGQVQSASTSITYGGPRKQVTVVTNEEGHTTTYSQFDSYTGLPKQALREGGSQAEEFEYNVMGAVFIHRLPRGGSANDGYTASTLVFDALMRLTESRDATGAKTTYQYDKEFNVTSVTPPAGGAITTNYDPQGRATDGSTPDGSWTKTYDEEGNVLTSKDFRGQTSSFEYDFLGRVTKSTVPGGTMGGGAGGPNSHVTEYLYDQFDTTDYFTKITQKGAADRVTKSYVDNRGRVKRVIAPDDHTKSETIYDELDEVVATQQLFDSTVQSCSLFYYDLRARVQQVKTQNTAYNVAPSQSSSSYTIYNKCGSVVQTVDPLGNPSAGGYAHKTTFTLDARERVDSVIDGKGNIVRQTIYGDDDLPIEVRVPDPSTKGTTLVAAMNYEYTGRKELKRTIDRNNAMTQISYNVLPGEVAQVTDPLTRIQATTYDSNTRRPTQVVEAQGTVDQTTTNYVWTNGLLTETQVYNPESGASNAIFKNWYDAAGRLERKDYPTVGTGTQMASEYYYYNEFSECRKADVGSKITTLTYNNLGQLTGRTWGGPYQGAETRTYNNAGMISSVTNGIQTVTRTWNTWNGTPVDESFSVTGQVWKTHTKTTDLAGNVVSLRDAENKTHDWPVDENNRPVEKKYDGQGVSALTYTPGGLIDTETLKDAAGSPIAKTIHSYDKLGRLAGSHTVKVSTNETLSQYGYTYDAAGQVTKVDMGHLGASFSVTTDNLGRIKTHSTTGNNSGGDAPPFTNTLVSLSQGNESAPTAEAQATPNSRIAIPARSATYVYGASGNRTSQTVDGVTTTYNYNALNQLLSETSPTQSVAHTYDEHGNETQRVTTIQGSGTTTETYGYNHLNQMSAYTNSATGATWQYEFYPEGDRYAKTNLATNVSELYVPRDGDAVTDYTKTGGGAPILQNSYVQGLGIDSKTMRVSGSTRRYYLGDMVGTVGVTMDSTAAIAETQVRDPWGQTIASSGATAERYGFAQRERDNENGLVYMRHRMYDPRTGRFTQTDPIRWNRPFEHYSYCRSNPTAYIDPQGLTPDGHHIIPEHLWEHIEQFVHGDKVKRYLDYFRVGKGIPGHNMTMHGVYNTLVGKELEIFLKDNNLKSISEFTLEHVGNFVRQIRANPAANEFLEKVYSVMTRIETEIKAGTIAREAAQKFYTKYLVKEFSLIRRTSYYLQKFLEYGRRIPAAKIAIALIAGGPAAYEALKKHDAKQFGQAALAMGKAYLGIDTIEDIATWGGDLFGEFANRVAKAYELPSTEEMMAWGKNPNPEPYVDVPEPPPPPYPRDRCDDIIQPSPNKLDRWDKDFERSEYRKS